MWAAAVFPALAWADSYAARVAGGDSGGWPPSPSMAQQSRIAWTIFPPTADGKVTLTLARPQYFFSLTKSGRYQQMSVYRLTARSDNDLGAEQVKSGRLARVGESEAVPQLAPFEVNLAHVPRRVARVR